MFNFKLGACARRWAGDESGATAIEYGMIACGISLAIIAATFLLGDSLGSFFSSLAGNITDAEARID